MAFVHQQQGGKQSMEAINAACKHRGGVYAGYSCKVVSWDDSSRFGFGSGGGLSCFGANITDTYLTARSGLPLFTLRSDNWNEKLGRVTSAEVSLVAGLHGSAAAAAPVTLRDYLKNCGQYGDYAGLSPGVDLSSEALDMECTIRFQTTFLPVGAGAHSSLEFTTESRNYQTRDDEDPKNLLLLCTSQGVAIQQDGSGKQRLFHHAVNPHSNKVSRHWLEAERSSHQVGGAQVETAQERQDALCRGKATASVIGTRAMGARFNVLMTIQVPLEQTRKPTAPVFGSVAAGAFCAGGLGAGALIGSSGSFGSSGGFGSGFVFGSGAGFGAASPCPQPSRNRAGRGPARKTGTANAARVSVGSHHDEWTGLTVQNPKRHDKDRITVTVVLYNTITGGVPSETDVIKAIDDMEQLYRSCTVMGHRADAQFAFANTPKPNPFAALVGGATVETKVSGPEPFPPSAPQQQQQQQQQQVLGALLPVPTPPNVRPEDMPFLVESREPVRITSAIKTLPMDQRGFNYLHDAVGLNSLQHVGDSLVEAHHAFRLADDLHVRLHGASSSTCLYNLACCFSLVARDNPLLLDKIRPAAGDCPQSFEACRNTALNLALHWLRQAVAAGYGEVAHMEADNDLSIVREQRTADFRRAVAIFNTISPS